MALRQSVLAKPPALELVGPEQKIHKSELPDPFAEERMKNPIKFQPLFIWIKDKNEMIAFAKAFVRKLREDGLNVVSDGVQTDPHPKYALEDSCEVFLPSGDSMRRPGELAIISVYRDGVGDQARLVMKVDAAYVSAFNNLIPALAYATVSVKSKITVLLDAHSISII